MGQRRRSRSGTTAVRHRFASNVFELDPCENLVHRQVQPGLCQVDSLTRTILALRPSSGASRDDGNLPASMGDEQHCSETLTLLVVIELLAAVVVFGRI